ncbi:MAG: RICIN domain-containing protein [Chitinophagales bacterium]
MKRHINSILTMAVITIVFLLSNSLFNNTQAQNIDPNAWYKMSTKWQGPNKSMEVVNGKPILRSNSNENSQLWKFQPAGNGFYRLLNKAKGPNNCIDILNDGKNNQPAFRPKGNYSGQMWKIQNVGGGYIRLVNNWQKGKSLDIQNAGAKNRVWLAKTGNYSGQMWKLKKVNPNNQNEPTPRSTTILAVHLNPCRILEKGNPLKLAQMGIPTQIYNQLKEMTCNKSYVLELKVGNQLNTKGKALFNGFRSYFATQHSGRSFDNYFTDIYENWEWRADFDDYTETLGNQYTAAEIKGLENKIKEWMNKRAAILQLFEDYKDSYITPIHDYADDDLENIADLMNLQNEDKAAQMPKPDAWTLFNKILGTLLTFPGAGNMGMATPVKVGKGIADIAMYLMDTYVGEVDNTVVASGNQLIVRTNDLRSKLSDSKGISLWVADSYKRILLSNLQGLMTYKATPSHSQAFAKAIQDGQKTARANFQKEIWTVLLPTKGFIVSQYVRDMKDANCKPPSDKSDDNYLAFSRYFVDATFKRQYYYFKWVLKVGTFDDPADLQDGGNDGFGGKLGYSNLRKYFNAQQLFQLLSKKTYHKVIHRSPIGTAAMASDWITDTTIDTYLSISSIGQKKVKNAQQIKYIYFKPDCYGYRGKNKTDNSHKNEQHPTDKMKQGWEDFKDDTKFFFEGKAIVSEFPQFYITPSHNKNMCIDVDSNGNKNGTKIQQWNCNQSDAQKWAVVPVDKGYNNFRLAGVGSGGKFLTVRSNSKENGAKVHLWRHNPTQPNNEILILEVLDYNLFRLKFKHSNKYLTVLGSPQGRDPSIAGQACEQRDWGNHANQKFHFTAVK